MVTFGRLWTMVSTRHCKLQRASRRLLGVVTHWYCTWQGKVKAVSGRMIRNFSQLAMFFSISSR